MGRGLISEDVINQVRDRVDIAEVVGHHVSLTRAGQNLKGLCPFHQEKSPSFTVSPSRQIFHCFGCGAGGNVFTFLMRITGANFPETVRELGQKFGINVPDSGPSAGPQAAQASRLEPLNQGGDSVVSTEFAGWGDRCDSAGLFGQPRHSRWDDRSI